MTRVYLINLSFGLAGVERRFANLWTVLRARGRVQPVLIVPSVLAAILRNSKLLPKEADDIIEVSTPTAIEWLARRRVPALLQIPQALVQSRTVALGYHRLWPEISKERGAVMHLGLPCSALRPPDMPAVYECMDATFKGFGSGHYRLAATRRVIVHCQSERIEKGLASYYASRSPRWRTITNPSYFANYPASDLGISKDPLLFAFVGRFAGLKNPLMFLEALAIARSKGVDCRALMLGEGPLRAAIDASIQRLGLTQCVECGFDASAPLRLARASVYVSLQADDNYGSQALLEAMGAGCAVIASDVGETARLISDAVGLRVGLSPDAVAAAMVSMASHPIATRQRGEAAARLARTYHSADSYAEFLESLYEQARVFHLT